MDVGFKFGLDELGEVFEVFDFVLARTDADIADVRMIVCLVHALATAGRLEQGP